MKANIGINGLRQYGEWDIHSMVKVIYSFRSRMVLLFGLSITLSGIISYLIFSGLKSYYHNFVDYDSPLADLRMFIRNIGDINLFLLLFVPLAIMFFYFLTKTYSTYFKKISKGIHFLAQGNF